MALQDLLAQAEQAHLLRRAQGRGHGHVLGGQPDLAGGLVLGGVQHGQRLAAGPHRRQAHQRQEQEQGMDGREQRSCGQCLDERRAAHHQ